jgi:hypothetical protein
LKLTKEQLAKKWGMPSKEEIKLPPAPPKKESPLERVKKKKVKEENAKPDYGELAELANIAQLEQEISKAVVLKYKAEQEGIKLKKESGDLIEYAMADYLFTGFMETTNFQLLTFLRKIEPDIKNYCKENEPMDLIAQINKGLETILIDVKKQQKEEIKKWNRGF